MGLASAPDQEIDANIVNNANININYDTWFKGVGATLTQNSGTTDLEADLDVAGAAGTFALAGGTLKGDGSLTGSIQNTGGTVAPGSSPGVLTVDGNYTQGAGGTLAIELSGTGVGTDSDRLVVNGSSHVDGTLALTPLFSFVPALSFNYDVLTAVFGQTGTFATVAGLNAGAGKAYVVHYPALAVNLTVTVPAVTRLPDGQIALGSGSFVGNGIYNVDGSSQSKSKTTTSGSKVTFSIKIQNDGTGAKDKFLVHATGTGGTGYTIKFKKGSTNITTAVLNGTYTTGKVGVGATTTITCIVTIGSGAAHGSHVDRLVTLTSFHDAGQKDAVMLTVGRT